MDVIFQRELRMVKRSKSVQLKMVSEPRPEHYQFGISVSRIEEVLARLKIQAKE